MNRIEIVSIATGEIVQTIALHRADESYVERVMGGLLINMDTDRYFAREVIEAPA